MSQRILSFFLISLLFTASCSQPRQAAVAIPDPRPVEPPREEITTLVLSVGGVRGLAHIGAIDAIKHKGIKVSSVFGNSMGAVIGGLYVTAPNSDLIKRYRDLISAYQKRIEQDTPLYRKIGIWLRLTEAEFDNKRFEIVMSEMFGRARIEDLPIRFATSYKVREGDTIRDVGRVSGDLAEAIARSANNPFIFKNAQLTYIDPGIDRMSAIPVEDAFRVFKPDRIIAVNVTGDPVFHSKNTTCKLTEVKLSIPDFRPEEELSGMGRNFTWLYRVGYDSMMDALNLPAPR